MPEAKLPDLEQMKAQLENRPMILLAGEQAAPNLLPVRYLAPVHVIIVHTDMPKSIESAENLALCLSKYCGVPSTRCLVDAYTPHKAFAVVQELLNNNSEASVNITGGTKPMSIGALAAARAAGAPAFYIRSHGAKTEVDLYQFNEQGAPFIAATHTVTETISIDEYLTLYFGSTYTISDAPRGIGHGLAFDHAVREALAPEVDEYRSSLSRAAMEIDAVVRCANQIAVLEIKTGGKALSADGIKQLGIADQKHFGTYVKRILIIDQEWAKASRTDVPALADALGIVVIELPSFAANEKLSEVDRNQLVSKVHKALGKTARAV